MSKLKLAKPILKWPGGKRKLCPKILRHLPDPKTITAYVEPFVGAASVFLAVRRRMQPTLPLSSQGYWNGFYRLSDANRDLVDTLTAVRDEPRAVWNLLVANTKRKANRAEYNHIRAMDPDQLNIAQAAARFIFLNRTGYNGVVRYNKKGGYNVPFGEGKPISLEWGDLQRFSLTLRGVGIQRLDFEEALENAPRGAFVYCDSPYHRRFSGYTPEGFDDDDHERLSHMLQWLTKRGVNWVASNSDTPLIRELYKGCNFEFVEARRSVGPTINERFVARELLITP